LAEQKKKTSGKPGVKKSTAPASKKTSTTNTSAAGKSAGSKKLSKKAEELQRKQRRDMWMIGLFLVSLITLFSAFGMKGFILEPIGKLLRGLFGIGSYGIPFICFAASAILLFSREKKVTGQLVALSLIAVLLGSLEHLVFCTLTFTSHIITGLYSNGTILQSGGLISGGIALLLSEAFSKVGAILIVLLTLLGATLYLGGVRMANVLDMILHTKERYDERKAAEAEDIEGEYIDEDEAYEDDYLSDSEPDECVSSSKPAPVIIKDEYHPGEKTRSVPSGKTVRSDTEDAYRDVRRRIDIPLAPVPDSADTIKSGEEEIPVSRIVAPHGTKIADIEPSVAKFNFGAEKPSADGNIDPEERISLTPIRKKTVKDDVYPDLPFDLDNERKEPVLTPKDSVDFVPEDIYPEDIIPDDDSIEDVYEEPFDSEAEPESAVSAAEVHSEEKTAPASEKNPPVAPSSVEVRDTHQEKEKSLGEKALRPVQKDAEYPFPPIDFLTDEPHRSSDDATEELRSRSLKLNDTLSSFGIEAKIINVTRGPSVTRYEMQLDRGVKISRLTSLQDDIALALGASSVRIAPIPDKSAVGIEVPNKVVQTVFIRDVLTSREMANMKSKIAFAIGKDIAGTCVVGDIGKMPHMLIAGTTGSGKSVCINSIIVSILYRATPDEVKLIMIDPKMVELGNYNGIPHLLIPVVTDYKKASGALNWAVVEMERRYKLLSDHGVRDLASYNKIAESNGDDKLPQIVIIIDELADLMMTAAKEVEESICRIAQKARAAGMHLIIATQRPSADVLTGLMKSNIPSRIAFTVSSQIESRIILDAGGAEKLIGRGDMLYSPIGIGKPVRVQGCFLSGEEIEQVVEFIKQYGTADYSQEILDHIENTLHDDKGNKNDPFDDEADEMFFEAVDIVMETQQASASMLQRKLKLGYARASRIIDQMEERGIIGGYEGSKPRTILISRTDWQEMRLRQKD